MRQRGRRMAQSHRSDAGRVCDASSGGRDTHQRGRGMAGTGAGTGTGMAAIGMRVGRLPAVCIRGRVRVAGGGLGRLTLMARRHGRIGSVPRMPSPAWQHLHGGKRRPDTVEHQAHGDQETEPGSLRAHGRELYPGRVKSGSRADTCLFRLESRRGTLSTRSSVQLLPIFAGAASLTTRSHLPLA